PLRVRPRKPRPKLTHSEALRRHSQCQAHPAMTHSTTPDARPDISVVVPFYNRADWVPRVISSLLSEHLPDGLTAEIIAVDNHSTDRTLDELRPYPVRIIQCAQPGPAAARNAGLQAARAPIVAFTDSDCLPDTYWLANLTRAFDTPDVLVTGGRIISYDQDNFVATFTDQIKILSNERFFEGSGYFPPF